MGIFGNLFDAIKNKALDRAYKPNRLTDAQVSDIRYKWHRYAMDRTAGCSEKGVDMVIQNANRLCREELIKLGATQKQINP